MKMPVTYDKLNKLWINSERDPHAKVKTSLNKHIWKWMAMHGEKIAQIGDDTGIHFTFNDVLLMATRAAQNLQKRGFKSREMFCFMVTNTDYVLPIYLASIGLSCPAVPLHSMLDTQEVVPILLRTKPSVIFCDASSYIQMKEALKQSKLDAKVFIFGAHVDGVESVHNLFVETGCECDFVPYQYDIDNDFVAISCSSGTTGPSKSACLSYGNHVFIPFKYDVDGTMFCFDSIYWTVGVKQIIESIYNGVARVITTKPFTPEHLFQIIEKYKITILTNTPFHMVTCLKDAKIHKRDLSSVKLIMFYGGKLAENIVPDIRYHFSNAELMNVYGMTEIGVISTYKINDRTSAPNGELHYEYTAKIVDDNGKRCGPYAIGELCLKNDTNLFGYYGDAAATEAAIDSDGFLHTGDMAYFDKNCYLHVEGRKKDIAKVFYFYGVLVPYTIEECLQALPGVSEVCSVAVPIACGSGLPAAVVVKTPGSKITKYDVYNAVAKNFPSRLELRGGVYFVEQPLPRTKTGKLRRKDITDIATELFRAIMDTDADIQSHLAEIPQEFRKLIDLSKNDETALGAKITKISNDTVEIDQKCINILNANNNNNELFNIC